MIRKSLFDKVSITTSRITTQAYSTSFSLGIRCLGKCLRNPLRDLHGDYDGLGRTYFPGTEIEKIDDLNMKKIEESIAADFQAGYEGIKRLPRGARLGVYVAFLYYKALFRKIRNLPSERLLESRVRIHNRYKLAMLGYSFVNHQLNMI